MASELHTGFIVTRNWRDTDQGVELELWLSTHSGPRCLQVPGQEGVFFLPREDLSQARQLLDEGFSFRVGEPNLQDFSMAGVVALYFRSQRQLRLARDRLVEQGLDPLEADINPAERYLMERFVTGALEFTAGPAPAQVRAADYQPQLKMLSIDIETAMTGIELYSIGVYGQWQGDSVQRVFMCGPSVDLDWVECHNTERALLSAFCDWLQDYDPDVLIGWNVINFDLWYLQRLADKLSMRLPLGRARRQPHWRELDDDGDRRAVQIPGRAVIDGIEMLRTASYRFESSSLENVSRELLGAGKLLHGSGRGEQIGELFRQDRERLAQYNIRDCELVWEIFDRTELLEFAIARSQMTGLALDRLGGSVAAFDFLYLPRLHRAGFIAPNASRELVSSPGGFVLDSQPGIYNDVLVLDFKSLYPSIIRTFYIDPLGLALGSAAAADDESLVPGFLDARFDREKSILPTIIEYLWQLRDAAKSRGDSAQSHAIKIVMNSFYGVLGTPGCRFFDARLASSITRRGHQIIQQTRDQIEHLGDTVIYGDTDSVFVWVRELAAGSTGESRVELVQKHGRWLRQQLNEWWSLRLREEFGLDSILELEFETHYQRFLMPTVRGSDKGSKKRYAGVVERDGELEIVFKGLENVRTDWTLLARSFQSELYRRVFFEEPYRDYIVELVAQVENGEMDADLTYRKRLRRRLDDYQRNVPPHVQAARLHLRRGLPPPTRGDWVEYVITLQGAEPVASMEAALDYQHYIDKQLAPVADGILHFVGTSFAEITGRQISLF
jgi:DNA polymerase-2